MLKQSSDERPSFESGGVGFGSFLSVHASLRSIPGTLQDSSELKGADGPIIDVEF